MNEIFNYELLHTRSLVITVGSILTVVFILIATRLLLRLLSAVVHRSMRARAVPEGRQTSFVQLIGYVLWTFGIILTVQSLGIDITFLVASSAALLVGIGLGLQSVFKDFVSGIIILLDGTVKTGDVVEVGGWVAKVLDVSLRTSTVATRDDKIVIIPNHKFIDENVVNWTHNANPTRFIISVGVAYNSDVLLVEKTLIACAAQPDDILHTASYLPFVRLMNFGDSSLDFELVFWSDNVFRIESTKSRLRFAIVKAFQENGINIPFPQMVLHQAKAASDPVDAA